MFERYWKPHFDTWAAGMGEILEKALRSPSTLRGLSNILNSAFRLKKVTDKATHIFLTSAGLSTNRDQKRVVHMLNTLMAQIEDMEARLKEVAFRVAQEDARQGRESLLQCVETLSANQIALVARLETLTQQLDALQRGESPGLNVIEQQLVTVQEQLKLLAPPQADNLETVALPDQAAESTKPTATKSAD